jgi:hypothetical protein
MQLDTYLGEVWGCDGGPGSAVGEQEMQAAVLESAPDLLVLDSCPPNAWCEPELNFLSLNAPGLTAAIPPGTFVELFVQVEMPWGCIHRIVIRNLPEWGGEPNPNFPGQRLWLVASDGFPDSPPATPFDVDKVPLGCYPGEPSCGMPKDDFVFTFRSQLDPTSTLELAMGETRDWQLNGPNGPILWTVRNLRSFESGYCDDYWNWAYWLRPALPEAASD